jgi:putative pyoverdin transport system ATP-binding/permease protein
LLEDRPVYVFDEWSAEQDVHFREQFYTVILPGLKQRGKTVIVVTHDDRFWHLADRVVKLDLGKVEWERAGRDWEQAQ